MEEIGTLITGVNCTYEDAIKLAGLGEKVVVLHGPEESENGKPYVDLLNFNECEAIDFFTMVDNTIGGGAKLVKNYI